MKTFLSILIVGLLNITVFGAVKDPVNNADVRRYMAVSGIDEMIDAMPTQIGAMTQQQILTSKKPKQDKEVMQLLADAWDAAALKAGVFNYIKQESGNEELVSLLAWKQSPLAMKITAVEAEANSAQFPSNLMRYIADLQSNPPSDETRTAIQRVVVATDMVDVMVETMVQVSEAMLTSMAAADPSLNAGGKAVIAQQIGQMRQSMTPMMEQQATLMAYYLYRNISNAELDEYAAFYEAELGRRELKLVYDALILAMSQWAEATGELIVQHVADNK